MKLSLSDLIVLSGSSYLSISIHPLPHVSLRLLNSLLFCSLLGFCLFACLYHIDNFKMLKNTEQRPLPSNFIVFSLSAVIAVKITAQ